MSRRCEAASPYRFDRQGRFAFASLRPCQVRYAILKNAADAAVAFRNGPLQGRPGTGCPSYDEEAASSFSSPNDY